LILVYSCLRTAFWLKPGACFRPVCATVCTECYSVVQSRQDEVITGDRYIHMFPCEGDLRVASTEMGAADAKGMLLSH
jgi:hypothetical protein